MILWSTVSRNITVTVSEDVYRAARVYAAHHDTSLSAIVADHLRSLTEDRATKRARALARLEALSARNPGFSASENLPRDALYDRHAEREWTSSTPTS